MIDPMIDSSFVAYRGNADFHDGTLLDFHREGSIVRARVRGASKKIYIVEFTGVQGVRANRPEGMLLYSLTELLGEAPLRRFVFVNWHEEDAAALEIDAEGFLVQSEVS
jgi:hypothetical protein